MKRLLLLRHAKSGWEDGNQRDFDRTLNAHGHLTADAIGAQIALLGVTPDAVLCSPAARTRETWKHVQGQTGWHMTPHLIKDIYMASSDQLLQLVQALHEPYECALLIGHNPGLEDLALSLAGSGDKQLRENLDAGFSTAALADIVFDVATWAQIAPGNGQLAAYVRPKDFGFATDDT